MIVFLDANALMQDPTCSGTVWHVLAHAPDAWSLRLVTSEVAVAEAVAGYSRRVDIEIAKLDKVSNSWGTLGVLDVAGPAREALLQKAVNYPDELESSLSAAGFEVLAVPPVPHMQVVSRSVGRRRPCDSKGDGYRDTLIWFSVLLTTQENPDEVVLFVTNDSDFMDDDRETFHDDLFDDLDEIDAKSRVRLVQVLADVALELAGNAPDEVDLRRLKSDLKDETVRHFIEGLLPDLQDRALGARECALPRLTGSSSLQDIGPIERFEYVVKGGLSHDEAVAEFSFEARTRIVLWLPVGVSPDEYEAILPMQADGSVPYVIAKPLVYRGIIRLGRFDRPLGGEVSDIAARPDDVGRQEWRVRSSSLNVNPMADILKNLKVNATTDEPLDGQPSSDIVGDDSEEGGRDDEKMQSESGDDEGDEFIDPGAATP